MKVLAAILVFTVMSSCHNERNLASSRLVEDAYMKWEDRYSRLGALVDSVSRLRRPKRRIVCDVDMVTCAFLVNNIDLAFLALPGSGGRSPSPRSTN